MARMGIVGFAPTLLCLFCLSESKISEYQLESEILTQCELARVEGVTQQREHVPQCSDDGRYRYVQCSSGGRECWCVNAEGAEIPNSRQNGAAVYCLSSCQFHRQQALLREDASVVPVCMDSGEYQPVQCDPTLGQCWCVDLEGMEVYGTGQSGRPSRCPGSCEVRERRVLHGVGQSSPPQCSADGGFLPVQCKFINTTDMMVIDLLHMFNRLPGVFRTFSNFRKTFPEISSYCFCADSRGRELSNTGVELLLDEVYDTAFSGMELGRSFSQSNMYRILQRRLLGVQLAASGRFRCPTPCESERSSGLRAGSVFVPSCDADGAYTPLQCQAGSQCWCTDSKGKEIFGTRQYGGVPDCKNRLGDCPTERRRALSKLFFGPARAFGSQDAFAVRRSDGESDPAYLGPCSPEARELLAKSGLLLSLPETDQPRFVEVLSEVIQGLFPSGAMALQALSLTANPRRLQENLFGGKFLKNIGGFNFTGAVGPRGTFSFSDVFRQVGLMQVNGDLNQLAKLFSSGTVNLDREISDSFSRAVNLKHNQNLIGLIGMTLENEQFFTTLRDIIVLSKAEDSVELGALIRAALQSSQPGTCQMDPSVLYVPQCSDDGQYQEVQCAGSECWCVDSVGVELPGTRSEGRRPRCPTRCEREREAAVKVRSSQSAGSEHFIPKCEGDGRFMSRQCSAEGCFCTGRDGRKDSAATAQKAEQCPTDCQAAAVLRFSDAIRSVLSNPAPSLQLSDIHVPRCNADGSWHQIQCDGPPESAFEFYREWIRLNAAGKVLPITEFLSIIRGYAEGPEVSFLGFLKRLFDAGHQRVFPALSRYTEFTSIPPEILRGDRDAVFGPSVFLDPLSLWQLLRGNSTVYPGQYSDFSAPLGHFHLRQCWCVSKQGDVITGTKATANQIPKCPGSCSLVGRQVDGFLREAEAMITVSNSSHVPLGYGFLLADGLKLRQDELLNDLATGTRVTDSLLSHSQSALRLAAHSTLHFHWRSHFGEGFQEREAFLLGYQPYSPQCDGDGQWLPTQCYHSTGHCWCVDEDGSYIPGSLTSRATQLPKCGTPCQRAHAQSLLSNWERSVADLPVQPVSSYDPSCEENGEFSVLQAESPGSDVAWCVNPVTGRAIQPAVSNQTGDLRCPGWCQMLKSQVTKRETGPGYDPECQADGLFSPVQCDQGYCWCVTQSGQELTGTRIARSTKRNPVCDTPRCPFPFDGPGVAHGAVLCGDATVEGGLQRQRCRLLCPQGYVNVLQDQSFLCDVAKAEWVSEAPLLQACQRAQVLQSVQFTSVLQLSLVPGQELCSSQRSRLQVSLLRDLSAAGLCSLQVTSPLGTLSSVSICDETSVSVECVAERRLWAEITWRARLSDLPVDTLPDLHDVDMVFSGGNLSERLVTLLRSDPYQSVFSDGSTVMQAPTLNFTCSQGYRRVPGVTGCVVCPAGTFYSSEVCSPCPQGFYQDQEGQDFCNTCPVGTSTVATGAFRAVHCVSECQRSALECTESGDYRAAQQVAPTGRWLCVTSQGEQLPWTQTMTPLSEQECQVLEKFETVPRLQRVFSEEDAVILSSETSETGMGSLMRKCVMACAKENTCLHLALFTDGGLTQCDYYSTDETNVICKTSGKTKGFLGNQGADMYQGINCLLKVKGDDKQDLVILRKKGHEFTTKSTKTFERQNFGKLGSGVYRTVVFETEASSLTDVHRFCQDLCSQEGCCDGFMLNQNVFNKGTIMCGLLSYPDLLTCGDGDWDVAGPSEASRICGPGVQYDKLRKQLTFDFGGQNFTISDAALPSTSKNKTGYQASLIVFQRIYLWKDSDMNTRPRSSPSCSNVSSQQAASVPLSDAVKDAFTAVDSSAVRVDSTQGVPRLQYQLFKHQHSKQQAELWCLKRCTEENLCHVVDIQDESPFYFTCSLFPDTQICGAYDKPLRQVCSLVLPLVPQTAYSKKVPLTGSVENFYSRVPFKKMVSYSVRSRVNLTSKPITEGFFECERRCDEDPCCRGIGYVRDSQSAGPDVLCLSLNSIGIQTCGEEDRTRWRVSDCAPSKVETGVFPFGWYEKPVNQWTRSPNLCPPFQLPSPLLNVSLSDWELLDTSSVFIDPSISAYDVIHISKDIAENLDKSRDWCLSACMQSEDCWVLSVNRRESAVRCVLYPDTHTCNPTAEGQHCQLLIKEPALYVYLRRGVRSEARSVLIPAHGNLLGLSSVARLGSVVKRVAHFLGVPYARPPVADLRFSSPQSAEWRGTWNATFPRPRCLQPGDGESSVASEDCLYLNIFVPSSARGESSVLVFFQNPTRAASNAGPEYLDSSYLAAVGNVIVVTANFRVAAFGFLSTASADSPGNYGFQDQLTALRWVQENIAHFGGDPGKVTLGAESGGADVASLHLTSTQAPGLFHRILLMGGSVFSPASLIASSEARELTFSLAREVGCPSSDRALSCLRGVPALTLNAAQTKLLSVRGPLRAWAPVVDGISVKEKPSESLQDMRFHGIDLLLGLSAEDGLISRAKNIKKSEVLQGRVDRKTTFYEALSNSLGGGGANAFVKEAATWFYSLHHDPSPAGYNLFSRALENATRDLFIICPAIKMASFWANHTRSNVFMYYLPEKAAHTSADLSTSLEIQLLFGIPHHLQKYDFFTEAERKLSLQMMSYLANFIKSGNPNHPLSLSRASFGQTLPPWSRFLPHPTGDNYKELDTPLSNRKGLRRAECSFWQDYVPLLTASTGKPLGGISEETSASLDATTQETQLFGFGTTVAQSKSKSEKDAYN